MLPPSPAADPDPSSESDAGLDELRDLLDDVAVPEAEPPSDPDAPMDLEAMFGEMDAADRTAVEGDRMKGHRIAVGVFIGLSGLVVGGAAIGAAVLVGAFVGAFGGSISGGLVGFAVMLGLAVLTICILAGVRFARYGDRGGVVMGWIAAVILLFLFPVGTPIGAYMIWVLTRPNTAPPAITARAMPIPAR